MTSNGTFTAFWVWAISPMTDRATEYRFCYRIGNGHRQMDGEIKLPKPQLAVLDNMLNNGLWVGLPREVVEEFGDMKDWRNVVGTGPLRLTDVVEGSSVTWEKNPNYWGYDEKFPQNRLPYIDVYRSLLMPDMSTRLAALRTGKIDYMGNTGDANIYSPDDLETLQKTNPEIVVWSVFGGPSGQFNFNWALPPVDDPNVRKALQMSVDRQSISATYFKGYGDPHLVAYFRRMWRKGFTGHMKNGPKRSRKDTCTIRQGQKPCLMRPGIHAAPTAIDSRSG